MSTKSGEGGVFNFIVVLLRFFVPILVTFVAASVMTLYVLRDGIFRGPNSDLKVLYWISAALSAFYSVIWLAWVIQNVRVAREQLKKRKDALQDVSVSKSTAKPLHIAGDLTGGEREGRHPHR